MTQKQTSPCQFFYECLTNINKTDEHHRAHGRINEIIVLYDLTNQKLCR